MNNAKPVAIVTGASRGIGAEIALRLANDGYAVVVNYQTNSQQAEQLVAEIIRKDGLALAVQADVSSLPDVKRLFEETKARLGRIDVLINNAGVLQVVPFAQTSAEQLARTFEINTYGSFLTMQQAGEYLQTGGRIINVSSTTLALNMPGYALYNGSKAAVEAFTRVLAKELRGKEITVNAVAPGPVATELFLKGKTEEQIAQFAKMPPLERLGQPEDIANVVAFLCSEQGGWVNGQVLRANGGIG
ncbi:SDR family oxidoreductase [Reinekea marinisedimentorum]|uniref:3-oxoacyl-[acyl-carrier protein] reductase n=1 Tax=Reinekea marinisedimentorum TaxID=230495 RepID=A0A4R3HWC4_9GAMM|nr:SDR family oxidoreductase [Reinekea marinisedimentorum]TCS37586.1 3-oxoacyl-[acyl-carrier protein] reductase [Reinekea marinisedimentorum]